MTKICFSLKMTDTSGPLSSELSKTYIALLWSLNFVSKTNYGININHGQDTIVFYVKFKHLPFVLYDL